MKREFIFSDGADIHETVEELSFKKAVKKFQSQQIGCIRSKKLPG